MMLVRKLFRTIGKYKSQFISMLLMIIIGVGVFLGFNIEWYSIEKGTKNYFNKTNFADYRIYAESGFSKSEIDLIKDIEKVNFATRWLTVKVSVKENDAILSLNVAENYGISKFLLIEGCDYNEDILGIWVSDKFAKIYNYKVGDKIIIKFSGQELELEIFGLVKSPEYMVCVDTNQIMPDFSSYAFCYVTPKVIKERLNMEFYNQIYIDSNLSKKEIESEINKSLNKTTLVLSLEENASYISSKNEAEEGKTMGSIIPVLFLVIAILTMITTMNRITKNEKTQIGTLKALGFNDKKILRHYTNFGLIVGIIGSIVGIILGYAVARIILSPNGMMGTYFDWSEWNLYMPLYCPIVIIFIILLLTMVSYYTIKKILKENPAEALRPYTPKKTIKTKLEKTPLWHKLSFGFRWNYRDIIKNKSRSVVTLIGVVGCVVLIVASMGMGNTMNGFMKVLNGSMNYNSRINLVENISQADLNFLKEEYNGECSSQISIEYSGKTTSLEIYENDINSIKFYNTNEEEIRLRIDGVYLCERLGKDVKVGSYIEFSPYGQNKRYKVRVAGIYKSLVTENIVMDSIYAESIGIKFEPTIIYTNFESTDIELSKNIQSIQTKSQLSQSYDTLMQLMNISITILMVSALVLALIVLYNLGVMGYIERYRELATIKVLGFKDKQISKLLIGQNTVLTIIGTIIGLPLGYLTLYYMVKKLASDYELKVVIYPSTYLIGVLLTILVSILVGFLISLKNKKIDMVEALKDKD